MQNTTTSQEQQRDLAEAEERVRRMRDLGWAMSSDVLRTMIRTFRELGWDVPDTVTIAELMAMRSAPAHQDDVRDLVRPDPTALINHETYQAQSTAAALSLIENYLRNWIAVEGDPVIMAVMIKEACQPTVGHVVIALFDHLRRERLNQESDRCPECGALAGMHLYRNCNRGG